MEKQCTKCERTLSMDQFGNKAWNSDGKAGICKECKLIANRAWQKTPRGKISVNRYNRKACRKRKEWLLEQLGATKCSMDGCNESHPAALDFHHRNQDEKKFTICGATKNKARLLEEALKCDVICSNCHRKLHWIDD